MTPLDALESQSIYILREAHSRIDRLAMLWSLGKDSNVMVWLARKAFFGHVPFPVMHVDTEKKFPEMYDFRTRYAEEWNLKHTVRTCPPVEEMDPTLPPAARSAARKTAGLNGLIAEQQLTGVIAGIRRDEEGTRAKERVFSPRGEGNVWDFRNQPPEFWDQFRTDLPPGCHLRVHPLLHWSELDVWRYIKRENIPIVDLYYARDGKRYRSLGDKDITFPVDSNASTIDEIIAELETTDVAERSGRAMDHEAEDAFERLRVGGGHVMATAYALAAPRNLVKIAIVGHVDHGKSTLVGRLLNDTDSLPAGKVDAVAEMCKRRGMPFEWAFVTDALRAERDQGITIDASHIRFSDAVRDYVLIDAPGHREFLKNMISGAAGCDAALVVIDADEGVREQSRRHGYLLHLLGVRQIAVAVTKMDTVDFDAARFGRIESDFRRLLEELGIELSAIVPVSGRDGDNIATRSAKTPWYHGPTVLEAAAAFEPMPEPVELPLRIPVQDVYKFDTRRIISGRVESGRISVGDEIVFSPSNHVVKVKSLEGWNKESPIAFAEAGEPVGITLEDQVFVERGELISHVAQAPMETNVFRARLFWLGDVPLAAGKRYRLKLGAIEAVVDVEKVERVVDTADLVAANTDAVPRDAVADVILRSSSMLALDPATVNPRTGRFVLADGYDIVGGGLIDMDGYPDQRALITQRATNITSVENTVTDKMRMARNGHRGGVLWFTGLSGAGKSTLAVELERRLFQKGYQVYVLDGDNLRGGLNANLGFSPEDRAENIRRVGEVAALFARAGFVVLTAFISPYRTDRERARDAVGNDQFHEVYVSASLDVCEGRDPKGLYQRARTGEIPDFTGISAPYETPEACEVELNTGKLDVPESMEKLVAYVEKHFPYDGDS